MFDPSSLPPLALLADSVTGLSATWEQVIGRLHPVLVHMPLGLFLAAGLFALLGGRGGRLNGTVRACLVLGVLVAVAAAASGWLFAFHDEGDDPALDTHRWAGVATVALGLVVLLIGLGAKADSGRGRAFRWGTLLLALVTAFAGHEGGELVWGAGYALEPLRDDAQHADTTQHAEADVEHASTAAQSAGAEQAASDAPSATQGEGAGDGPAPGDALARVDFATQVMPIFAASCLKCHGPERARGRLRLDAREFVFSGDNQVIVPGDPQASELYQRVTLPVGHEDVMPEKGDHLGPEQIDVLRRWIDEGATWPE